MLIVTTSSVEIHVSNFDVDVWAQISLIFVYDGSAVLM